MNMQIYAWWHSTEAAAPTPGYGVKTDRDSSLNVNKCADNMTSVSQGYSPTELVNIVNNSPTSPPLKLRAGVADYNSSVGRECIDAEKALVGWPLSEVTF